MGVNFVHKSFKEGVKSLILVSSVLFITFSGFSQPDSSEAATADAGGGNEALMAEGKAFFEGNCTSCHQLGSDAAYPNLEGITKRRSQDWLKSWIYNPSKFAAEDAEAAALMAEWKPKAGVMNAFDWMTDEQWSGLYAYLEVAKATPDEVKTPPTGGPVDPQDQAGGGESSTTILSVVLVVLVLIIVVLLLMFSVLMKHLKEKQSRGELEEDDSEIVNQRYNILSVLKHPAFIGIVVVISLAAGGWYTLQDVIFGIGVDTGYQPVQPIPYSHKIHAGQYEIDCNYCHTGVRKSKNANIPSGNICMNCHIAVKTDSEILKSTLYKAMDWTPEEGYGPDQKPIEWVRVHNLPDHVYFNHAQHVQVGEIECQECHGPIEEMDGTVYQYSTLTMGWCIDCHRKTKLNVEGNAYYDELVERHDAVGEGDFTVEKNGGTECARCHY